MSSQHLDFEPKKLQTLTDSEQIKAYVHPTRLMLLRSLVKERRTISSIAKEFGVHPANITHHFRLLEKAGLIRLVERRDTGRNVEKYYRAVAYGFVVKPGAGQQRKGMNKKALGLSILRDNLSVAVRAANESDEDDVIALLGVSRLKPQDAERLLKTLNELVAEFKGCDSPDGKPFTINFSVYPNEINGIALGEEIVL